MNKLIRVAILYVSPDDAEADSFAVCDEKQKIKAIIANVKTHDKTLIFFITYSTS